MSMTVPDPCVETEDVAGSGQGCGPPIRIWHQTFCVSATVVVLSVTTSSHVEVAIALDKKPVDKFDALKFVPIGTVESVINCLIRVIRHSIECADICSPRQGPTRRNRIEIIMLFTMVHLD